MSIRPGGGSSVAPGTYAPLASPAFTGSPTLNGTPLGAGQFADKTTWAASTAYVVGDIFTYAGRRYIVKTAHTSTSTFDQSKVVAIDTGQSALYDAKITAYNVQSLKRTRLMLAKARAGGRPLGLACYGDSITAGGGATDAAYNQRAFATRLRSLLPVNLNGTVREVLLFDTGVDAAASGGLGLDPRVVVNTASGNNWGINSGGNFGMAGIHYVSQWGGTSAPPVTITPHLSTGPTPGLQWDTAKVYVIGSDYVPGYQVDSGSVTNAVVGTHALQVLTISAGSLGLHTLTLYGPNLNGVARVVGVEFIDSTATDLVRIAKFGRGGTTSDVWDDAVATGGATYAASANVAFNFDGGNLDTMFYMIGTNDADFFGNFATPKTAAYFQTHVTNLVTAAQTAGLDVVLVTPPPFPGTGSGLATYAAYYGGVGSAYYNVADARNCCVLDLGQRWGSWASVQAAPYSFMVDGAHPEQAGHWDIASAIATFISAVTH